MSRSKRDILDTENMLARLTHLLQSQGDPGTARADAETLRRISMTLHRWHKLECNEDVVRGYKTKPPQAGGFVYDEKGNTFICRHNKMGMGNWYLPIPDREASALKRLKVIMTRYPSLQAYVQTDPRGCALYILRPGDVPKDEDVSACYSRGLAVFR